MKMQELIDIPKLFGGNVRKIRTQKKLTQTQLAEKLGISQKHLSVIETGTKFVSAPLIAKISSALETSPAELFGGTSNESKIANAVTAQVFNLINPKFEIMAQRIIGELKNQKN